MIGKPCHVSAPAGADERVRRKIEARLENMRKSLDYQNAGYHSSLECLAYLEEQIQTLHRESGKMLEEGLAEARIVIAKQREATD
ncbi:hypothetical protein [Listeria booriae]|uniref:Uncharacterized protein n=1 Tax=Listeria booriae TaxID=1552123 RepID=A0A7X0Z981_9LIST|nr:hypothetical protein [Listeria booriae]MBC1490951.1 hypothetical protein [Listeria booriae]MBC1491134.1 hypothetical protein [Listeria booriae]MBC2178165.1 hypothetical protein [Listeria booriae]MBC2178308.1 hypothetical protein [Listeria booriae]MBC2258899.1 hypothetical protein [Listeria booriae]